MTRWWHKALANLRPDVVEMIALKVVKKIETIVDEDGMVYVFTSAERRIDVESFASVTGRGYGTPLISDTNGGNVSAKIMKDTYKWECMKSLYDHLCLQHERGRKASAQAPV